MVIKTSHLMMYKAKVAVCSEIRTKHSTQSEHHVEFLNSVGVLVVNKVFSPWNMGIISLRQL